MNVCSEVHPDGRAHCVLGQESYCSNVNIFTHCCVNGMRTSTLGYGTTPNDNSSGRGRWIKRPHTNRARSEYTHARTMRDAFYVRTGSWQRAVVRRGVEAVAQALKALADDGVVGRLPPNT